MLVRCLNNKISGVDSQSAIGQKLRQSVGTGTDLLDVTVRSLYTVYAVAIQDGNPSYFIADDLYESLSYPLAYASILFEEFENCVSSCWKVAVGGEESKTEVLIAFKEWIDDDRFYENLIDGNDREVALFRRYKVFMDMEYPSPSVTDEAKVLEGSWLMCSKCSDAWESESTLGMIHCPKCSATLLNPRYLPSSYPVFRLNDK